MSKKKNTEYLLESSSLKDMRLLKKHFREVLSYQWDYYSELARQRKEKEDEIRDVLFEKAIDDFEFESWQRAVKWRYSNHPLCTIGSLSDPGGRFNIGEINTDLIPQFSALYVAEDRLTAEQELLGQEKEQDGLTYYERALTNKQSIAVVSVKGTLETVLDIRNAKSLIKLNNIFKNFKLSPSLRVKAKKLGQDMPTVIKTAKTLKESLLDPKWRQPPMRFDIPANSQIFGQMVKSTGITGIMYPSKMTGKDCLAIFPDNFKNSESFIELSDTPPNEKTPKRIDGGNYQIAEQMLRDIC